MTRCSVIRADPVPEPVSVSGPLLASTSPPALVTGPSHTASTTCRGGVMSASEIRARRLARPSLPVVKKWCSSTRWNFDTSTSYSHVSPRSGVLALWRDAECIAEEREAAQTRRDTKQGPLFVGCRISTLWCRLSTPVGETKSLATQILQCQKTT